MVGPTPESWAVPAHETAAQEIVPGLWRLRLPLPWEGISHANAYLIRREDGVMLVDCGTAGHESCWQSLAVGIERTGHEPSDVRALVATHAHSDHIGFAARLIEQSGCEFWMHPDHDHFYDVMRDPSGLEAARGRRAAHEGVPPERLGDFADVSEETDGVLAPVRPDHALVEGVELDSVLGPWEVIETPGHAPSHVCLHQPDRGIVILGDLVSRVFAPYFDYGYTPDPVAEFVASLRRVSRLDVTLALPGHGRPLDNLDEVISEHLGACEERVAATEAAVREGPAGAYEITRRVFSDSLSRVEEVWHFVEVVCYLKHLRRTGRIVREAENDLLLYRVRDGGPVSD